MDFLFNPKLNVFFQSFSSPWLTVVMLLISAVGSSGFLNVTAALVMFGFHFRKGLLLLHAVVWTSLLSDTLKQIFRLPRPTDVDPAVSLLEEQYPAWLLELFPLGITFGLPSGHVSSTTVFWVMMMILFRYKALKIAGFILIVMMPLSRIYLGRHFLGDVIGGLLLAGFVLLVALRSFSRERQEVTKRVAESDKRDSDFFESMTYHKAILAFYVLPVLASPFFAPFHPGNTGKLLGLALGSLILFSRKLPAESENQRHPVARFSLAAFIYLAMRLALRAFVGGESPPWSSLLIETISVFAAIWGTVELAVKLGLYKRR